MANRKEQSKSGEAIMDLGIFALILGVIATGGELSLEG